MSHIPSGLVRNFQSALQLKRGDSFFREANQVDCQKPLVQRCMGVVEDGACSQRELILAINTLVQIPHLASLSSGLVFEHTDAPALDAARAVRPADFLVVLGALFGGREPSHGLKQVRASLGFGSHNGDIVA